MKKLVKVFGLLTVIACLCLSVAACGDSGVEGTYEYSLSAEGASSTITLELKSGGKMTMTIKASMGGQEIANETVEGTYKVSGEKLTLTVEGEDAEATIKDGKITMEAPNMGKVVLTKK